MAGLDRARSEPGLETRNRPKSVIGGTRRGHNWVHTQTHQNGSDQFNRTSEHGEIKYEKKREGNSYEIGTKDQKNKTPDNNAWG